MEFLTSKNAVAIGIIVANGCKRLTFGMAAEPDPKVKRNPLLWKWSKNACRAWFAATGYERTRVIFFEWICDKPQFRIVHYFW